ncbi:MAG: hypothetical protein IT289_12990 [Oligoflexia bacterium]|nr:hypothetical protein [Oligoflexia bacterium]
MFVIRNLLLLNIFLSLPLAAASSGFVAATSCHAQISSLGSAKFESNAESWDTGISVRDLKFLTSDSDKIGTYHEVFKVHWRGEPVVFLRSRKAPLLRVLDPQEAATLRTMSLSQARRFAADLHRAPYSHFDALSMVRAHVAAEIADVHLMQQAHLISWQGRPIGPKVFGVVRNRHQIPEGYLMAHVEGTALNELVENRSITVAQYKKVRDIVSFQLGQLEVHGLFHGDPHLGNIIVKFEESEVSVQLIDFNFSRHSFDYGEGSTEIAQWLEYWGEGLRALTQPRSPQSQRSKGKYK